MIDPSTVFSDIIASAWRGVLAWEADEAEETSYLEFKRKEDSNTFKLSEKDKSNLSKAISGFANSYGGVVVFGVHALKGDHKDGPDRVRSILPISDIEKSHAYIEKNLPNLIEPPVPGASVSLVRDSSDNTKGIIVIYVPDSHLSPHRARGLAEVQDRYYMRSSTETVIVPHAALAAMFGRRPPPRLIPRVSLKMNQGSIQMLIWIRNEGKGFARNVAVQVASQKHINGRMLEFEMRHFNPDPNWFSLPQGSEGDASKLIIQANQNIVIYPGSECFCAYYHCGANEWAIDVVDFFTAVKLIIYNINSMSQTYQIKSEIPDFRNKMDSLCEVGVSHLKQES